ncbi:hypothetical protein [Rhodalgimonas zhirmunskyi]|nr:hypothetical protein [Rhodoalgimonas zhirmunskyi]
MLARDFDTICAMMAYPSLLKTVDAEIVLNRPEDYVPSLEGYCDNLDALGTREFHRICRRAEFTSPAQDEIVGEHATYILSGAGPLLPPYTSKMVLVLENGRWLARDIRVGVMNSKGSVIRKARA